MGNMHNVEPLLGTAFSFGDKPSHPVIQDFGTGAGQRVQAGFFQRFNDFCMGGFFEFGNVRNFRRTQCMELQVWVKLFQLPE